MTDHSLTVERIPVDKLTTHPRNSRQGDVGAISESLAHHGQYRPIVVQKATAHVLAGNHTLMAARALGWDAIDAVVLDVDDDEAARILLVDNKSNDLATYDTQGLVDLLAELARTPLALAGTGYDGDALDELLADLAPPKVQGADVVSEPPEKPVTKPGDLWELGPHRLLCGDCRNPDDVAKLLDGAAVNMAFTSPPYADRRKYDETSGFKPIPPDEYVDWFAPVAENVRQHLAPDGSWFVNIKPNAEGLDTELYVLDLVLAHAREWGWHFATEFCWERPGLPQRPARRFKNQFEPVYQFARADWRFRPDAVTVASESVPFYVVGDNYVGERRQGDGSDTLAGRSAPGQAYPGNRLQRFTASSEALGHAASFPVGLPAWFARAYTDLGDTVFDPFMGSGSTLIASEQEGRVGYGTEISPAYCDVIAKRYQGVAGIVPVRDGKPHDFLAGGSK